jgi:hypothetical protein
MDMREVIPDSFTVYTLDELSPAARESAIWNVGHLLTDVWWDAADNEEIEETIIYGLAQALGTPGWDEYGEADFPGIPGVTLQGWDLDRGDAVAFAGELNRENAPKLPWTDGLQGVHLQAAPRGEHTYVGIAVEDDEGGDPTDAMQAMSDAVVEAILQAKDAGLRQLDYLTSGQRAEEYALDNKREFTADGELYVG